MTLAVEERSQSSELKRIKVASKRIYERRAAYDCDGLTLSLVAAIKD